MLQEFVGESHGPVAPPGRLGEGVSVCLTCEGALAIYREVTSRGIAADRPFVGNHMWVVGLTDPDGYRLFFESVTDAPEDSVWSGDGD